MVTGAAGFIGYHVSMALLRSGHQVIGYDNLGTYYPAQLKRARLDKLQEHEEQFNFIAGDICRYEKLTKICQQFQPDRICHLAAQAGVRYSITHPFIYQKSNIEGFLNLLECCRNFPIQRLVYASSSSVYGGNTVLPFRETDRVDTPISLYAATKKANELMAYTYTHLYNIHAVGLRFFTVYGPWGRPDMALWIFTEKILAGEPIPVFNAGQMKRDFTYIDDIVNGVINALFADQLGANEIFNLGNHRSENLMEMIHKLETIIGRDAIIEHLPMQPGDVPATYADIQQAVDKLNFSPQISIDEGIPRFCEWYLGHPKIARLIRRWRSRRV